MLGCLHSKQVNVIRRIAALLGSLRAIAYKKYSLRNRVEDLRTYPLEFSESTEIGVTGTSKPYIPVSQSKSASGQFVSGIGNPYEPSGHWMVSIITTIGSVSIGRCVVVGYRLR